MITRSTPNAWLYAGIICDHEWEGEPGSIPVDGAQVEVEEGDVLSILHTGSPLARVVSVTRRREIAPAEIRA